MSDEWTDAALVAACRRGGGRALATLVERYQMDVFGTALRLTRNRDTALELANGVFYKAYQNLHAYDETRPLRPWLLRITTNETLNWLRSQRRERDHVLEGESGEIALELAPGSESEDPEYAALILEQRERVRLALAALPERYRVVLTLRYFDDLSYAEIAEVTGQDANAVGVQLLRARNLLKKELTDGTESDRMSEVTALRVALALDADELAFLRSAALPARFIALVQAPADPRAQLIGLLWLVLPVAIGYAAWLAVAPLFTDGLALAAQAGGSALVVSLLANVTWGALDSLADIVEAASAVPGFNAPLVTLSLIAVALYAAAVLTPARTVRQSAPAV